MLDGAGAWLRKSVSQMMVLCILVCPGWCPSTFAAASPNVPVDHWSYPALERIEAFGLIHSSLHGTRPFSRDEMARLIKEALTAKEFCGKPLPPIIMHLLEKLQREFKAELDVYGTECARSSYLKPVEEAQIRYVYTDGDPRRYTGYPGSVFEADAIEGTPLVYNNDGVVYGKYNNFSVQFASTFGVGDFFAGSIEPIFLVQENEGHNDNVPGTVSADLLKGYGKLSRWNVELEFGRDSMWWGPGRHGELLITNNATPFDMLKLSNPEPVLLPWYFSYLGPFKYTIFLSRLEDYRVRPLAPGPIDERPVYVGTSSFGGWRVDCKPHPLFELGVSSTFIFGGPGIPSLDFGDVLGLFGLGNVTAANNKINQLGSFDFRLRLPWLRNSVIYGEYAGEDAGGIGGPWYTSLFNDVGYSLGLYVPRLTDDGMTDLRVEWAKNAHIVGPTPGVWYGHNIFIGGYAHDDLMIGHHMFGDAEDLFVRITRYLNKDLLVGLDYDYMKRGITLSPVQESINQWGVDITYDINAHFSVTARYGFEIVDNFDLVEGDTRHNNLVMTTLKVEF